MKFLTVVLVVVFCVACGKLAGFDDLQGLDGNEGNEGGTAGEAGEGSGSAPGGSSAVGGVAGSNVGGGSGSGATGGTSDGEGGSGAVAGNGGSGGDSASGGVGGAGAASGVGATAGMGESGGASGSGGTSGSGASGATAGSSGANNAGGTAGTAGTSGSGGGGAGIGNPSGCGELLTNGGFEQDRLGWDVMSSYPNLELNVHEAIVERTDDGLLAVGVAPYAGDFVGWAGGVPDSNRNHSLFVTQPIAISADVTELTFSGYFRIESDEPIDTFYDALYVEILDSEYERLWQFGAFSNQHAGPWFAIDAIEPYPEDLDALRGGQFHLGVYSRTDNDTITHFFFDSLSLIATCE